MLKKILYANLFASQLFFCAYASYKQRVEICMNASENSATNFAFYGHFGSTDYFDKGHSVTAAPGQRTCVAHTYQHGPKNIGFKVGITDKTNSTLLTPGASCNDMYNTNKASELHSDHEPTNNRSEAWEFKILPTPPIGDYKYTFVLECTHHGE